MFQLLYHPLPGRSIAIKNLVDEAETCDVMSYLIEKNKQYVKVVYHGTVTYSSRIAMIEELRIIFRSGKTKKRLLVDSREAVFDLSTIEQYQFGVRLAATTELRGAKVAIVKKSMEQELFVTVVAENRGYFTKSFIYEEDAINWLICESESLQS